MTMLRSGGRRGRPPRGAEALAAVCASKPRLRGNQRSPPSTMAVPELHDPDFEALHRRPRTDRHSLRAGTDLLADAGPALDRLASASLRVQNGKAREVLHISALPTFAMRWVIPRLPEFQREHPALETRIVTASTPAEQFRMGVDIVVSGPARQPGWIGSRFLGEAYLPLLSHGL